MEFGVGSVLEGKVTGITKFGAFVSLPEGKSGLVHISEIAYTYVNDVKDYLQEGQEVKVKVIGIKEGKISLSMKALETAAEVGVEDDYREVYSAVLSLPEKYRAVIHLHYFEGLSVAEMAQTLDMPEGTIKSQLSRGRALLRDMLKEVEL